MQMMHLQHAHCTPACVHSYSYVPGMLAAAAAPAAAAAAAAYDFCQLTLKGLDLPMQHCLVNQALVQLQLR
jgi:hypothetical protein